MKKIYTLLCLLLVCSSTYSCLENKQEATEVKLVTAAEMQSILELEDVQLVDVRTPQEHEEMHIANSQNIDFSSANFEEDISKLDKKKPVIVYCKSGGRSSKCSKKMKDAGFEKVYDLEGGISKWKHSDILDIKVKS
ncbi:rhodanese-like domain-containing protein [Winogradskyella eckloniae]|uniref:rhodanese-like domain-containing protein n=1 Tax=Winogradskyella eckloniae TaxID=1089306 RepID=UPI0015646DBE|nr:rhodanese-like domain-containing protein [Winogradskyella eckloniae]NRD20655.1 rhodanese-like domain-containing protein [Winogradskyella eckloniae]